LRSALNLLKGMSILNQKEKPQSSEADSNGSGTE